ncbi:hypothetical protein N8198_03075 [Gammaproteobacteria bacterium]|nr:hypothetical protein [Gammaproteobacteria bacterium]
MIFSRADIGSYGAFSMYDSLKPLYVLPDCDHRWIMGQQRSSDHKDFAKYLTSPPGWFLMA